MPDTILQERAWDISQRFAALECVDAVVMGGSGSVDNQDQYSDIDLYVYSTEDVPLSFRQALSRETGRDAIIDHRFWETGDFWVDQVSGLEIDIMYRSLNWVQSEMDNILDRYQSRMGYTTCFWYNILHSHILFDRHSRFYALQSALDRPYPSELKKAIIAKNYPLLHEFPFSYLHQIYLAMKRKDILSLNHRTAEYFASFFDVLFALNELPHPGEKRMLSYALRECRFQTPHMEHHIGRIFKIQDVNNENYYTELRQLSENLKELLIRQGLYSLG